jgi:YYY domain-containing protein
MEGLFALLYAAWIGVRLLHPDLWHVYTGGEKPMDFAYLNAVIKSAWFPPYNPWFAGSKMNYYYFGSVFVGTLIKLIGTLPTIAYNLAVPLLCAMTGLGAFSVAYNLFGGRRRGALVAGTSGLVFTLLLGNLGVVHFVRGKLIEQGGELIPSTIPGFPEMVAMIRGWLRVAFTDAALEISARASSWYWHPTRIIPASPGEVGPITEFPAFTFLYGDLHVNMIALPLVLLALAVIVYWVRTSRPHWGSILIGGLVIGALLPTHTWDYPTYLVLALAGLAVGAWAWPGQTLRNRVRAWGWRVALLVGLTLVLYLPYMRNYVAGYTSASKWEGSRTPLEIYFWIHGIQLFPLLTYLLAEVWRLRRVVQRDTWMIAAGGLLVVVALGLFALGYRVALLVIPVAALAALPILAPWMPAERRLLWLMVGLAMALSLAVEVIVLAGDVGRMNTVFRFYQQAWVLLSIAAAVSLAWLEERVLPRLQPELRQVWWIVMALLVFGGALFLPFGARARAMDRISPDTGLTLDGMAFMQYSTAFDPGADREVSLAGDYAAIRWLQDNVEGSPVILEGLGQREYLWANRVSVYTGLPAVVGWSWHQRQQRVALAETMVGQRRGDVDICYSTSETAYALELLNRYGVRYIYVGDYERAYYDPLGLAKFDALAREGALRLVYDAQGVKIYEVAQRISGTD